MPTLETPSRNALGPTAARVFLALFLLCFTLGVAAFLYKQHQQQEDAERLELLSVADKASAVLAQSVDNVNGVLNQATAMLASQAHLSKSEVADKALRELVAAAPNISSLVAVNADGVIFSSNRPTLIGNVFKDSARYRTIRGNPDAETLYVSEPFVTPLGRRAFTLGRMLSDKQGGFNGYVLAVMSPAFFEEPVQQLLGQDFINAALIHEDGLVIYRLPDSSSVVGMGFKNFPNAWFWQFVRSPETQQFEIRPVASTGIESSGVLQVLQPARSKIDKKLVFAVARSRATVADRWYQYLFGAGTVWLLVSVAAIAIYRRKTQGHT